MIILLLLINCKSYSNFTYWDIKNQTQNDLLAQEEYNKIAPNSIKDESVLIKFNISDFKDKLVILNNSDTISFTGLKVDCGEIMRRIPKSSKKIVLYTNGENKVIIPIRKGYDFIKIQGINNHKWNIIYSQFYPKFDCM